MSNSDDKNVKRYGRREQKEKLSRPESVFPPENDSEFDMDSLPLPDTDSEALASLASLSDEVTAAIITPQSERYPPLAPSSDETVSSESEPASGKSQTLKYSFLYNIITFLMLIATIAFIAWAMIVWSNPQSSLNPLPPATPFLVVTATPGESFISPTSTPDESGQIFVVITDTPAPTIDSPYPFIVREILYIPNSNDMVCNWWSIAGTVIDSNNAALNGYRIRVIGNEFEETVFSGASQTFGAGGFEFPLSGTAQEANFTIQLFSPQEIALSEVIPLTTRADCEGNVSFINFVQNR
jgi:hypothetical protein